MEKKSYKSKKGKYFIGWFPKEEFLNLTKVEREDYREYRRYHRLIYNGEENINKWKKEISKLKTKIKDTEDKINGKWGVGSNNIKFKDDGWKKKMLSGYSYFGKKTKDYEFYCSVNLRKRKSKILIQQQKGIRGMRKLYNSSDVWGGEGDRNNPSVNWLEYQKNKKDGKGKEEVMGNISERYYIKVESMDKGIWGRNLYVGTKENVFTILNHYSKLSDLNINWEKVKEDKLRNNLREVYKGYVRFQIYKNGVRCVKMGIKGDYTTQHPIDKVIDWMNEVGSERINQWLDK